MPGQRKYSVCMYALDLLNSYAMFIIAMMDRMRWNWINLSWLCFDIVWWVIKGMVKRLVKSGGKKDIDNPSYNLGQPLNIECIAYSHRTDL